MRSVPSCAVTPRRAIVSTTIAAAAALLALLTWWVSFRTGLGHRADVGILRRVAELQATRLHDPLEMVAAPVQHDPLRGASRWSCSAPPTPTAACAARP